VTLSGVRAHPLLEHPIVSSNTILGATTDSRFVSVDDGLVAKLAEDWSNGRKVIAEFVSGPLEYRYYTRMRELGRVQGGAAYAQSACAGAPQLLVNVTPPEAGAEFAVGMGGDWNALPRVPKRVTGQAYEAAVRNALERLQKPDLPVKIEYADELDLDGDGSLEAVVFARSLTLKRKEAIPTLDEYDEKKTYALIALVRDGKLGGVVTAWSKGLMSEYDLSYLDANGDGRQEIFVSESYHEGHSITIYSLEGPGTRAELSGGCSI
jgi:hypothetical protein